MVTLQLDDAVSVIVSSKFWTLCMNHAFALQ